MSDSAPQVYDSETAAAGLTRLKEHMSKPNHDPDYMIETLQPNVDAYRMLKYFPGNVSHFNIFCFIYSSCMHVRASEDVRALSKIFSVLGQNV
jgi:hypothetical protein